MASSAAAGFGPSWRDDAIVVDRDGIPHYTGAVPGLMTEYRRRVLFAYDNLEGSGDDETKEARSLAKKKSRFAKRLMDALHGEAWKVCQDLMTNEDLKKPDGYKLILKELMQIEKVGVVRKTESFEAYFERCHRKRGQTMDSYLRVRKQAWDDLKDLSEGLAMSEDLLAFFALKNAGLSKEERRHILLANQSAYTLEGIERALRISYHDVHERERGPGRDWSSSPRKPKGGGKRSYAHAAHEEDADLDYQDAAEDEDHDEPYVPDDYANAAAEEELAEENPSDQGASNDDEIFDAYASYRESRQKLKDIQKNRGFKPKDPAATAGHNDERRQALAREKARTRCSVCNRIGHWAGDRECPKRSGHPAGKAGRGKGGKGSRGKAKAYYVAEQPTFFTIDDSGGEDGFCNMVAGIPDSSSEDDRDMAQDDGRTELDDRRKAAAARSGYLSTSDWDYIEPPLPSAFGDSTAFLLPETKPTKKKHNKVEDQVPVTIHVPKEDVEEIKVKTLAEAQPARLQDLRLRELQCDCDRWGIATSGTKAEVQDRLERLYAGQAVKKKNCTKKFVRLVAWGAAVSTSSPGTAPTTRTPATAARRSTTTTSSTSSAATVGEQPKIGGTFRYSGGSPQEATICPRTGLEVPRGMEIGGPVPNLSCMACGVPMVLRRRRDGTAFFFGISNFPTARSCKYTLELDEGLAMVQTKGKP